MSLQVHMNQFDTALAAGAVTSPAWVPLFEQAVQYYLLLGGAVLLTLRLVLVIFELCRKVREHKSNL